MPKKVIKSKPKKLRIQKKSSRFNTFAIIAVAAILASLFLLQIYRSLSSPLQIAEITNSSGTVNLALNPAKTTLAINEETQVTLTYDVLPGDGMSSIKAELTFDPTLIAISNIVIDDKFPTQLASKKVTDNKITFTFGVGAPEEPDFVSTLATGQGTLATFKAKALKAGSATFAISASTLTLTKNGGNNNSLREISNATVAVTDPTASPSTNPSTNPSSTPSTVPSATPSIAPSILPSTSPSTNPSTSPSVTPSVAPSKSPDASIPAVQKPSAPGNLVYNCYSDGKRITLRWSAVANVDSYEVVFDQKDGDNDQTKSATRAEIDLDIKNNTSYKWSVVSIKGGVKSDVSSVNDIKCSGDVAQAATPTPTPTPTATPTPTPAPTKKPITQQIAAIFKPKSPSPTPTPKPTLAPTDYTAPNQNSNVIATPTATPGSLGDIFASPTATPVPAAANNTSFISKILLGWQALFIKMVEVLTN